MMEWASSVYHAISIANGGAYVLQYERDRVAAEEEVMLFFTLIDISLSLIRPPKMLIPKYWGENVNELPVFLELWRRFH